MRNTTAIGKRFTEATIQAVWEKGRKITGKDPNVWRKDSCGATIKRDQYGNTTLRGWEIDHKHPKSRGGSDNLRNLQPLQWENNRSKGDDYPEWTCKVRG